MSDINTLFRDHEAQHVGTVSTPFGDILTIIRKGENGLAVSLALVSSHLCSVVPLCETGATFNPDKFALKTPCKTTSFKSNADEAGENAVSAAELSIPNWDVSEGDTVYVAFYDTAAVGTVKKLTAEYMLLDTDRGTQKIPKVVMRGIAKLQEQPVDILQDIISDFRELDEILLNKSVTMAVDENDDAFDEEDVYDESNAEIGYPNMDYDSDGLIAAVLETKNGVFACNIFAYNENAEAFDVELADLKNGTVFNHPIVFSNADVTKVDFVPVTTIKRVFYPI